MATEDLPGIRPSRRVRWDPAPAPRDRTCQPCLVISAESAFLRYLSTSAARWAERRHWRALVGSRAARAITSSLTARAPMLSVRFAAKDERYACADLSRLAWEPAKRIGVAEALITFSRVSDVLVSIWLRSSWKS